MKLGVIGEPCIDYIHGRSDYPDKHLGGIIYSLVSLALISEKSDEIFPIMNLGEDEFDYVTSFLSKYKNIKHDFIYRCSHKTRVVSLYYNSAAAVSENNRKTYDREESSTEPALPLSFQQIKPALSSLNGLLVNMISGIDITLDTLTSIRRSFDNYIHMDLHNVVMQTHLSGKRTRSSVADWLSWCTNCNTLQMNEAEIAALSPEGLNEYKVSEKILASGKVRSVTVTRGRLGSSMYELKNKSGHMELDKIDIPPVEVRKFRDSTGCGDVFASSFFYKTLENNMQNLSESLHFATRIAARKAQLTGPEELDKLVD